MFERWHPSLYNYRAYGVSFQKRIRTTNVLVIPVDFCAFSPEQSLLRLVASIMMDINKEWITGRKYRNMEID